MLADELRTDLTAAMKARDEVTKRTLRMAIGAVMEASVAGPSARELSDDEIRQVLAREVKRRDEAAAAFTDGGRVDRAERELAEREVLARYLPTPLTGDELDALVAEALTEGGYTSPSDMGAAMRAATAKVDGRADGKAVSTAVKARLNG